MTDLIQKKDKAGTIFLEIDPSSKRGTYTIAEASGQHKLCEKINLLGFDASPSGLRTTGGYGLTGAGFFLLQELSGKSGKKIELTLSNKKSAKFSKGRKTIRATIPHPFLLQLNAITRSIKYDKNQQIRAEVRRFLAHHLPKQFGRYKTAKPSYAPGALGRILGNPDVITQLNSEDRKHVEEFIPAYMATIEVNLRGKNKLQVVYDKLDASRKIQFKRVIKEFKRRLKQANQSEASWQQFLSQYILILRTSYGQVLEKESVTLSGKFPDFMLIDPYSYLDIYEIKTPNTSLLGHDKSRNNYYWHSDLAKAISQVENYLHQVQANSHSLILEIKAKKGFDVSIVRPRGYIIAGMRKQLENQKMEDDFRILNDGLKDVDVIFYDDLLSNLESFVKKIGVENKKQ